jgi:hypothetical protein
MVFLKAIQSIVSGWPNAAMTIARTIRTATVEIRYLFIIPTSKKS